MAMENHGCSNHIRILLSGMYLLFATWILELEGTPLGSLPCRAPGQFFRGRLWKALLKTQCGAGGVLLTEPLRNILSQPKLEGVPIWKLYEIVRSTTSGKLVN